MTRPVRKLSGCVNTIRRRRRRSWMRGMKAIRRVASLGRGPMWISRTAFEKLIVDRHTAEGRAHALDLQVQSQKSTMDWMAMRLTQSEHERAQLIHNYTGVKITVPSIEPAPHP